MLVIVLVASVFSPATFEDRDFLVTLAAHFLIFIACFALPWSRLPKGSFLAIPVLDCLEHALRH